MAHLPFFLLNAACHIRMKYSQVGAYVNVLSVLVNWKWLAFVCLFILMLAVDHTVKKNLFGKQKS